MDILQLIKKRKTIRKYQDKPIPKRILDKIIEAGIWGPSVPSFLRIQPWRFVIILNRKFAHKISNVILNKSQKSGAGVNILLSASARIIQSASAIILIYNSGELRGLRKKYKGLYSQFEKIIPNAELSAISAAIQNMILTAENLGIGSCWLDTPLFCRKEINKLFNAKDELVAILTLGFPAENGTRALRKPLFKTLRYIV